jgi:hypothetical protein
MATSRGASIPFLLSMTWPALRRLGAREARNAQRHQKANGMLHRDFFISSRQTVFTTGHLPS